MLAALGSDVSLINILLVLGIVALVVFIVRSV